MALLRVARADVAAWITLTGRRAWGILQLLSRSSLTLVMGLAVADTSEAESFILNDGSEISGEVIQGFSQSIMVRSVSGTVVPLTLDSIQLVRIDLANDEQIHGQLLSWKNDVFLIEVNDQIMRVAEGKIDRVDEGGALVASPTGAPPRGGTGGPIDSVDSRLRNAPL
jgi:hypothetical protein